MIRWILLAILILLIARTLWRFVDGILEAAGGGSRKRMRQGVKLVRDPVCGTYVTPGNALSLKTRGETHHFCSEECRNEFWRRT